MSATVAGLGVSGTSAYFTDRATISSSAGGFAAATIATPATPQPRRQLTQVQISWSPATAVGETTVTSYEVYRYAAATGGAGTLACTTTAPTLTCTDSSAPLLGTFYYQVRARIGTNWVNDSARALCCTDVTPPTITFVGPAGGTSYPKRDDLRDAVKLVCQPLNADKNTAACGRATDPSGVTRVQFQLQRSRPGAGPLSTPECYNNVDESWAPCPLFPTYRDAVITTVSATEVVWELRSSGKDVYDKAIFNYTLSIIATDGAGNTSSATSIQYSVTTDG